MAAAGIGKMPPGKLAKQAARFADRELVARTDLAGETIPRDIWERMGKRGLLGCGIPTLYGGGGASFSELLLALEAFVGAGASPGLALSWFVQLVAGKILIEGAADGRRKKELLPEMAAGRLTVSIALSEPGAGSDPRRIATKAVKRAGVYVVDGQKAWLTNGPMADRFVVFAVEGEREGRKRFTALIVPRETPGLTLVETPPLGFLRPAPHCSMRLESCAVPESAVLGRREHAWEDLSKPFRMAEDALLAGVLLGGTARELALLADRVRAGGMGAGAEAKERIGAVAALLSAARGLSLEAAKAIDDSGAGTVVERRLAAVHPVLEAMLAALGAAYAGIGLERACGPGTLGDDMNRLFGLGGQAARARRKKWGEAILIGKERS